MYWARLGCWISPYYGQFWFGVRFETYKPFVSLIFQIFFGLWQTVGRGLHLYIYIYILFLVTLHIYVLCFLE